MFSDWRDAGVIASGALRSALLGAFRFSRRLAALVLALHLAPAVAAPTNGAPPSASAHTVEDSMAQRAKACTGCHGPQGRSRPDGYIPRLAGKPAGYLHEQLTAFQQGRRRHEGMARMLEPLGDEMLWALAGHFEALEVPYPAPVALPLSPAEARRAEQLVRQGDPARQLPACADCHGAALAGRSRDVAQFRGGRQRIEPAIAAQASQLPDGTGSLDRHPFQIYQRRPA